MKRSVVLALALLIPGLTTGCTTLFTKPDIPPPLPPIIETKPPIKMNSRHFEAFPWDDLSKPRKDGNDPDTSSYTLKDNETLENVAESRMGNPAYADRLATFNELSSTSSVKAGDKVVVPNPIIGVKSQIMLKEKGKKDFGDPTNFGIEFKKGDEYKLRFEPNVNGHLYVFRKGTKDVTTLFPARPEPPKPVRQPRQARGSRRDRPQPPLPVPIAKADSKVRGHDAIEIPVGLKGFAVDPKKAGEKLFVFFSLKPIQEFEDEAQAKKALRMDDLEDVRLRVKEADILTDGPYHLIRINDPGEILEFNLNIDG